MGYWSAKLGFARQRGLILMPLHRKQKLTNPMIGSKTKGQECKGAIAPKPVKPEFPQLPQLPLFGP